MSRIISPNPEVELEPESGAGYTPAYREFFMRLRRARIERGLSLTEMAELVGLPLKSAYDFENLAMPLPFEWLEVWCQIVGVPFEDYLVVYWDMEEDGFQAQEREVAQKEVAQNAPCITNTGADETDSGSSVSRGGGWLSPLRDAFGRIFRSRLLTQRKTFRI